MKKNVRSGFTLIEMLVVIIVIAMIAGFLLPAVFGALEKEKILSTEITLKNLGDALEAYKSATKSYPDDYEDAGETRGPVVAAFNSDRGYFWWLQNYSTKTFVNGTVQNNSRPFFPEAEEFRFTSDAGQPYKTGGTEEFDDNFIRDLWDNDIQYRKLATTIADFRKRFLKNATKDQFEEYLALTGGRGFIFGRGGHPA